MLQKSAHIFNKFILRETYKLHNEVYGSMNIYHPLRYYCHLLVWRVIVSYASWELLCSVATFWADTGKISTDSLQFGPRSTISTKCYGNYWYISLYDGISLDQVLLTWLKVLKKTSTIGFSPKNANTHFTTDETLIDTFFINIPLYCLSPLPPRLPLGSQGEGCDRRMFI